MSKLQTVILGVAIALYAGWRVNMIAKAYRKQRGRLGAVKQSDQPANTNTPLQ
jgi:hypothetical protein